MNAATFPICAGNNALHAGIHAGMIDASYISWRLELEQFCSALGARCLLEHVSDACWRDWFESGQNPEGAVLAELLEAAD
jgi:hypothetical protein